MTDDYLKDVKIVFVSDYYDVPLSGHAWYKDRYCFFEQVNPEKPGLYRLYELPRLATMIRIVQRKLFEDIVGYQWTKLNSKAWGELISKPDFVEDNRKYWTDEYINFMMAKEAQTAVRDRTDIGLFYLD